jgi:ech hydrogenase subunit D
MRETIEKQEVREIAKDRLLVEADSFFASGCRLIQICALKNEGRIELDYSFGKDFGMTTLRFIVAPGESVPSVSHIWRGAFLYENDIQDLYGVTIDNLAVNYGGAFYDVAKPHPFAPALAPTPVKAPEAATAKKSEIEA